MLGFIRSVLAFDAIITARAYDRQHNYDKLFNARKMQSRGSLNLLQMAFQVHSCMEDMARGEGALLPCNNCQ